MRKMTFIFIVFLMTCQTGITKLKSKKNLIKEGTQIIASFISQGKNEEAKDLIIFLLSLDLKNKKVLELKFVLDNKKTLKIGNKDNLAKKWAENLVDKAKYYKKKYPLWYFTELSHYAAAKIANPKNKEAYKKVNTAKFIKKIDISMEKLAKKSFEERAKKLGVEKKFDISKVTPIKPRNDVPKNVFKKRKQKIAKRIKGEQVKKKRVFDPADLDPRVRAGRTFTVEFPDLPETLQKSPAKMSVVIPVNYDINKQHPLFLWVGGGRGGHGNKSQIVENQDFISIGLPLWRLKPNSPSPAGGVHLLEEDWSIIWKHYKIMIAKLETIVPNIHKKVRLAGGFSNGGHCLSILMNNSKEFTEMFKYYIFAEGGYLLTKKKVVRKNPFLFLWGDKGPALSRMAGAYAAVSSKKYSKSIVMKDTGHSFPAEYYPPVYKWIKAWVLPDVSLVEVNSILKNANSFFYSQQYNKVFPEIEKLSGLFLKKKEAKKKEKLLKNLENKIKSFYHRIASVNVGNNEVKIKKIEALENLISNYPKSAIVEKAKLLLEKTKLLEK